MEWSGMWLAECPQCQRRRLYGVRRVRAVRNLAVGVIAVELVCRCGAPVTMLTGSRVTGPDDRLPAASP